MTQVQWAETWVSRGSGWWKKGLEQERVERKCCQEGERQKRKENPELFLPPTPPPVLFLAYTSFGQFLCSCNEHTHMWSLQGRADWHVPGGASGRCRGKLLFQLQARQGCLVSCTPPFYFPFFTGGNRYASTLLTLNICSLLLGQLVESNGLYPRNWLFDHRLISVGKYHSGNDSVLQLPQQSHFFSPEGHILKSQMVPVLQQNPMFSPHPRRLASNTSFSSRENIYAHLFSTIPNISLGLHQWGDGSTYIIAQKLKIRDLRHRDT